LNAVVTMTSTLSAPSSCKWLADWWNYDSTYMTVQQADTESLHGHSLSLNATVNVLLKSFYTCLSFILFIIWFKHVLCHSL